MKQYAYIRVSTKEQNVDRQILALEPYHISKRDIYCDYQSGKDFERPAYQKLLKKLKEGDLLIVKSNKTVRKTISKLASGKKYYVKVRAYRTINGKKYYGNYSAVKAMKVK